MKESAKRWILIGSFTLATAALALVSSLRPRSVPNRPAPEAEVTATPAPTAEEDSVAVRTPVPTPVRPTPVPAYPPQAVNLLVNGAPLFALDSREIAEELIRTYFHECAYENIDRDSALRSASVEAELSTVPADGSVEYVAFDVALNKLRKNRSLIPVRRTVESVERTVGDAETQSENTRLLPIGSRMFLRCGVGSRTLVFSETHSKDGLAVSRTETLTMSVVAAVPRSILIGAYHYPAAGPLDPDVLDPNEGMRGPVSETLSFAAPIEGELSACFGLRTGEMHYGVDWTAVPGTPVTAPESGTIVFLGERPGCGFVIEIRHEDGFLSRICIGSDTVDPEIRLDRHVVKGEQIAALPAVEGALTSTLHYELLIDGVPYNPLFYVPYELPQPPQETVPPA